MYTLLGCIKHKCRDSYVLYIPTVLHTFGLVLLTHTLLVQTHTHDVSAPWFIGLGIENFKNIIIEVGGFWSGSDEKNLKMWLIREIYKG